MRIEAGISLALAVLMHCTLASAQDYKPELRLRGEEYSRQAETKWHLEKKKNELTDKTEMSAASEQRAAHVTIQVIGTCIEQGIFFEAILLDEKADEGVAVIPAGNVGADADLSVGRWRANDFAATQRFFAKRGYDNNVSIVLLTTPSTRSRAQKSGNPVGLIMLGMSMGGASNILPADEVWRIIAEITTERGPVALKIPLFDPAIQELIKSCG